VNENYQNWVERIVGGRDAKPLNPGEVIKTPSAEPFGAIEFVKVQKKNFAVEIGKKGDQYIYHFYPAEKQVWRFKDPMSEALLEVFKNPEQIECDWVEEFQSFAVRVRGWANTVWGDELAIRAIDLLEQKLGD
jgi:hypothetical protein